MLESPLEMRPQAQGMERTWNERLQGGLPLVARPFAVMAEAAGVGEEDLLEQLHRLLAHGLLRRLGPVFQLEAAPARFVLVGVAVPGGQFDEAASQLRQCPEVALLRRRDHRFNLWLLLAAETEPQLQDALAHVAAWMAGHEVLVLRERQHFGPRPEGPAPAVGLAFETRLLRAVSSGLPLVPRPYEALAAMLGVSAEQVCTTLAHWQQEGLMMRLGAVPADPRQASPVGAAALWNVDDAQVQALGPRIAALPGVVRCSLRLRHGAAWPFNLWVALRAASAAELQQRCEQIAAALGPACHERDLLRAGPAAAQTSAPRARLPQGPPEPPGPPSPPGSPGPAIPPFRRP